MTTKPESSKSQPADASSRSKGEASIAIASLPGYLHFMFTFPPRNASPLEVRAWLSRWRLDVAHVVAKTYVALNHEKKEATFKREFGWFEKAVAKIEITGRQLRDADDMWLAKRFLEAGFDFDIASLMMKDIFLAKLMGESMDLDEETKCMTDESAQLQEETRKSLEERNKAKMERMELPKEQKELKQETKKLKQELRAKREERVRILKIHEEILDRKGEVSREQEAEWEKVLRRTAGEGKETRAVHVSLLLFLVSLFVLCKIDFVNRKMLPYQSYPCQIDPHPNARTEPHQLSQDPAPILFQIQTSAILIPIWRKPLTLKPLSPRLLPRRQKQTASRSSNAHDDAFNVLPLHAPTSC